MICQKFIWKIEVSEFERRTKTILKQFSKEEVLLTYPLLFVPFLIL